MNELDRNRRYPNWQGPLAFIERGLYLTKRYFAWEMVWNFYNIVFALTMGYTAMDTTHKEEVILSLVLGALLWTFMSNLFHEVANTITWERWEGTIEYTFMSPVKRLWHLVGMSTFAIAYGLLRMFLVAGCLMLFFSFDLSAANLWAAGAMVLLSIPAFIGLGFMAAIFPLLSPEKGTQAVYIFDGFLLLVSGIYYSIDVLPGWLQKCSYISPATYVLRSARKAILQGSGFTDLWIDAVILVGLGVVLIPAGFFLFKSMELYAMRAGKLKRSG